MESTTGTIKRITANGYGFIAAPDGVEYFFHQSACTSTPFDSMREGDNVTFTLGRGPKGPPRRGRLTRLGVCAAEKIGHNIKWNAVLLTATCSSRSCRKSSCGADS